MQHFYQSRYQVTIGNEQSPAAVYFYEKCEIEEAFVVMRASKVTSLFIGKLCLCKITEVMGDDDFESNTVLLESEDNECLCSRIRNYPIQYRR